MAENLENQEKKVGKTRRDFLNVLLSGGLIAWIAAVSYPIFRYLKPPKIDVIKVNSVKIGKVSDMQKDSGKIIKFGNEPVIVLRLANGNYRAFSATCTHLSCIVQYRKDYGQIYCACHNGRYDLHGRNISGPPPAPLAKYDIAIKNDEVTVYKPSA